MSILIIGGGVIGCALARELARRGAAVHLFEARGAVGEEASGAALGTLSYSPSAPLPEGWHALAAPSLAAHRALSAALADEVAEPPRWHWSGRLNVATTNAAEKHARTRMKGDQAAGAESRWLDSRPLREWIPAIGRAVVGGSLMAGQGWVDAPHLTRALAEAAQRYGATFHLHHPVARLLWEGARVVGLEAGEQRWYGSAIVLAAGAWSGRVEPHLSLPVEPVRGQALRLDLSGTTLPRPLFEPLLSGNGIYLLADERGVSVGATHERVGFTRGTTVGGISGLLHRALELLPGLGELEGSRLHAWSGFRPATPDKVPVLGPDPRFAGVWWATGHFRSGVLLAPHTATLLTDALLAGAPLDARWEVARWTPRGTQ